MTQIIKAFKLDDMFMRQKGFMRTLYKTDNLAQLHHNQGYINTMVLAAIAELTESLNETPWKPWKQQQVLNVSKFKDELVDVFHFFINLCIAAKMDADELYTRFIEKNNINHQRQKEGY